MSEARPPLPPFSEETATPKIRAAEDAWNSRDPERVPLAYTADSQWRNRRFHWDRGGPRPQGIPASPSLACDRGASR